MNADAIRLSATAVSFIETDVLELAADPDAYGLGADEARIYALLADAVNVRQRTLCLRIAVSPADRDAIFSLLNDQSNLHDDMAEGRVQLTGTKAEARRISLVLGHLAAAFARAEVK